MFGRELRRARREAGLTQDQLAKQLEELTGEPISRQGIGKWELDETVPERNRWPALETVFGKPPGWVIAILEEVDKMSPYGPIIKAARFNKGLDQGDLAEIFGVTQQMISTWERTGNVPRKHWDKLNETLGVNLAAVGPYSGNTNTSGVAVAHSIRTTIGQQAPGQYQVNMGADEYRLWELFLLVPENRRAGLLQECRRRLVLFVNTVEE